MWGSGVSLCATCKSESQRTALWSWFLFCFCMGSENGSQVIRLGSIEPSHGAALASRVQG